MENIIIVVIAFIVVIAYCIYDTIYKCDKGGMHKKEYTHVRTWGTKDKWAYSIRCTKCNMLLDNKCEVPEKKLPKEVTVILRKE